jgi:VWFA-related protein
MKTGWVLLLTLVLGASAAGQGTPQRQGDQTISVNVDLVDVRFTVADRKGKLITRLKQEDFKIFEDNRQQVITNFASETDLPLTVALLVDTSGSIREKLRFEQEAAIEFFHSSIRRGTDKALVISFDSGVELLQDFTDDPDKLTQAIMKIRAGGGTSLYDALYLAITEKLSREEGRRVLILISDGDDNSSRVSMTETLELAQKYNVAVYTISTNTSAYFGSSQQARGDNTLKKFAEETGGRPFFPFKLQDLAVSFQDISEELRAQYTIAYRPSNQRLDGAFRRIRIDVADRNLKAKHRTGYYAPRAAASQEE